MKNITLKNEKVNEIIYMKALQLWIIMVRIEENINIESGSVS